MREVLSAWNSCLIIRSDRKREIKSKSVSKGWIFDKENWDLAEVHDKSYWLHKFFSAVLLSSGRSRRHLSAPEGKRTWAALQAELADRSGSCVGLSSAFGCFGSGGKTRHFYASRSFFPLNYVTVKTTFWRSQPTTWIPPIKVTLNKNKAIRHNTLDWYNCYNRLYVYGAM